MPDSSVPDELPPPLDARFFPLGEEGHRGLERELRMREFLLPSVVDPADYHLAMEMGYEAVLTYLLDVPLKPSAMDPLRLRELHGHLYGALYCDAGKLRTPAQSAIFGGRIGADSGDLEGLLSAMHRSVVEWSPRWTGTILRQGDRFERLLFVANYHATFVMLHPFRDGNGRLARVMSWWQEWCLLGRPRHAMSRNAYMAGLRALPSNLRLLHNFFLARHGLPLGQLDPLPPIFPVWTAPSQE